MAKKAIKTATVAPPEKIKASKTGIVTIPGIQTEVVTTLIIGTAPLICHSFAEKTRGRILAKHMGEASEGREKKDPYANYEAARYRLSDGSDGVPAAGLKGAIVDGFGKDTGVFMSKAKGGVRVTADDHETNLVRIFHRSNPDRSDIALRDQLSAAEYAIAPRLREDVVRNESGVVDIRHRPEYWPWAMKLTVLFPSKVMSMSQVLQAIAKAGFCTGLGEWRPGSPKSKTGTYGTWQLATAEEIEAYEDGTLFADFGSGMLRAAE